jgi:sucrose-6-phosphate hydrolase SacC (GH32 family)
MIVVIMAQIACMIKSGAKKASAIRINFTDSELQILETKAPLSLAKNRKLNLHIFIDHSVLGEFANESVCITKIISPLDDNAILEIHADGGGAKAKLIQAWPIKTIW